MTDGIIQKVFKSWEIQSIDDDKNTIVYLIHDQIRKREKRIMQELIEKIKQEFPTDEIPDKSSEIEMIPVGNINIEVSRILIGDNQE